MKKTLFKIYELYSNTIHFYLNIILTKYKYNSDTNEILQDFINNILKLSFFMIEGRFEKNRPKERKSNLNKFSPDMIRFLSKDKKIENIQKELDLLDIIKFFKVLENFLLKRKYMKEVSDFKLGKFSETSLLIYHSLPKLLLNIDSLKSDERKEYINLIFSAISIYRHFKVKTVPNSETINGKYTGKDLDLVINNDFSPEKLNQWTKKLLSNNKINKEINLTIYSGNASSPNSNASATKLLDDVAGVLNNKSIYHSIIGLATHFKNGDEFCYLVNTLTENIQIDKSFMKDKICSRLFHFTANGGKARMIANVDWLSQSALSGIHFFLFDLLRTIDSDFTFDHKKGIPYIMNNKEFLSKASNKNFFSIDLSAATDRMPRVLQGEILKSILNELNYDGESISKHWLGILDRVYSTVNSPINEGRPIRYEVGQGMGLFTSWPIMAIMHHYIVNVICDVNVSNYAIVGDDLLLYCSDEQYNKYIDFMTSIGLNVNPDKTIASQSQINPTIEFARNYVIQGENVSIIPFGVLFAWNDKKISFETVIWHFSKISELQELTKLFYLFKAESKKDEFISLLLYLYKIGKIDFSNLPENYKNDMNIPSWINNDIFSEILKVTTDKTTVYDFKDKYLNNQFMSTYTSQCTLRNEKEILLARDVAEKISLLSYIDYSLENISNIIYNRLTQANLITYDQLIIGGPLLTKRERKLLLEINKNNNG